VVFGSGRKALFTFLCEQRRNRAVARLFGDTSLQCRSRHTAIMLACAIGLHSDSGVRIGGNVTAVTSSGSTSVICQWLPLQLLDDSRNGAWHGFRKKIGQILKRYRVDRGKGSI